MSSKEYRKKYYLRNKEKMQKYNEWIRNSLLEIKSQVSKELLSEIEKVIGEKVEQMEAMKEIAWIERKRILHKSEAYGFWRVRVEAFGGKRY